MVVGLYTSRIMLQVLGVDNYGINNVVGGIVAMSSLITGAVSSAITRFITYAIGEGDKHRMRVVFSTSMNVMIAMAIIAVLALEVIGVWFLNYQADIPDGRMTAAHWVLQCSIVTLFVNLINSPYNATIIAHERMSMYAYIGIAEVMLKLAVCFAIIAFSGDRLILFAVLNVIVAIGFRIYYTWYCKRNFSEANYEYKLFDRSFFKEMTQFTGWYMVGNTVWVFNTQGLNMLINVFFGVVLNAARGVAISVTSAITAFVNNFTVAFIPQITKSYATGEHDRLLSLVFKGSKFTWYLLFLFIIPAFLEADTLLDLWLGKPPAYASLFLRFALIETWSINFNFALHYALLASGKLKRVQIRIALYTSFVFPVTWLCFYMGAPVWISYVIFICFNTSSKYLMLQELQRNINFPMVKFIKDVFLHCIFVTIISFSLPGLIAFSMPKSYLRLIIVIVISSVWSLLCDYVIGLSKSEKQYVNSVAKKMLSKIKLNPI